MKKIAIFLTLTAAAPLLGGCYFAPPPYHPVVVRPAARVYRHPVVVPVPRVVVPAPPPVYYYP